MNVKSNQRKVRNGLYWVTFSTVFNKILSFVSQIVLGYLLSVETYGVFAIVVSSMIFVNVFQNTGVSKVLISRQNEFDSLIPLYSAFNFILSIIGAFLLIALGFFESNQYDISGLVFVYFITAISIPIISLGSIYSSKLSSELNFKCINVALIIHAFSYYTLTIALAWLGFDIFVIALATFLSAIVQTVFLRYLSSNINVNFTLSFTNFISLLVEFKYVLITTVLASIAMRADFFVLAKVLEVRDIGFYYFGFMLVMSVTVVISSGINQTLLPFFSTLKENNEHLGPELERISSNVIVFSSLICLLLILFTPEVISFAWRGKWDDAIPVVLVTAIFIPLRMLTTISYAVLEAKSYWSQRTKFSLVEISFLILFVYIGASNWGLIGAVIGTATQRILSGILSYTYTCKILNSSMSRHLIMIIRSCSVFYLFSIGYVTLYIYFDGSFIINNYILIIGKLCFFLVYLFISYSLYPQSTDLLMRKFKKVINFGK